MKKKLFIFITLLMSLFTLYSLAVTTNYKIIDDNNSQIGIVALNQYNATNYFNKTNFIDTPLYFTNYVDIYKTNDIFQTNIVNVPIYQTNIVWITNNVPPPTNLPNILPTITITSPTNNQIFQGNSATINIVAEAKDSDGSISKVEFYVGDYLASTDIAFPYSYSSLYGQGQYNLQAKAYDNSNAVASSLIVGVLVTNIPPPVVVPPITNPPSGNTKYVRAGATGANDGSDWNNAYPVLPATLQRGFTYYISGGTYPSYSFNTEQVGNTTITVKKASLSDHGTDVGWVPSYGNSQTIFSSQFNIYRGYFIIDGQYRNENDWFDGASYGIKIQHNNNFTHMIIRDNRGIVNVPNVTVKNLFIAAQVGVLGTRPYAIDCDTYSSTLRNPGYVFSRVFVLGSNNPFFVRNTIDPLIEYCASEKTSGSATYHGEVVNRFYSSSGVRGGGIVRYCHFRNCYDGTSGYARGGGTGVIAISETSGMEIYGNIFESYYVGDGAIAAGWVNNNIKVYNNTFINGIQGSGALVRFTSTGASVSGNVANNNLAINCANSTYNGAGTFSNNSTEPTSICVNYAGKNYRLNRHTTTSGINLPNFNIDMDGKIRGSDGKWDLGAFQYIP